jgi:glycosyltransferase involved in cell wall biosynthesis
MAGSGRSLKVALVVGTLGQGGAEKQLVYIARALHESGIKVGIYSLTRGEHHEKTLQAAGLPVVWIGQSGNPLLRLARLVREMIKFEPDVIQSTHTFANIYAALAGRILRRTSLGALRSDLAYARAANGRWTMPHLKWPSGILANSQTAYQDLTTTALLRKNHVFLFPNVIELAPFDHALAASRRQEAQRGAPRAIFVGRLVPVKRVDRFLRALAAARELVPALEGTIVGDGSERPTLEKLAFDLGLSRTAARFVGQQDNIPAQLEKADVLVLCSESEGFPNVLLEAMAARLPVVTTPAGDAASVVLDGVTGYVVPFEDHQTMAERLAAIVSSPFLHRQLGKAGRNRVEQFFSFEGLSSRLRAVYAELARTTQNTRLLHALSI